ncbi:sulfotransferase domain protein [Plesiocystis pacifica SIR-1]|uniref:Sulfotransferase domain protein n=1 Tax=Plesiocystis pacifica SIR-1 TaxID=391625 RepID=A6FYR5_9BACT|nr:sulfotransferase [Plesiocystis pacifica]EDM81337.1 sulfotransferase domain protein [Plesiocystis pacifica SIR-1]
MPDLDPSFLICSERSGSNLLRSILNAHSQIHAPQPIHLGAFWERAGEFGDLGEDRRWRALLGAVVDFLGEWRGSLGAGLQFELDGLAEALSERSFAAIYGHIYGEALARSGKAKLFIKENHTAQRAPLFLAAHPQARFVLQIRDPRDVVASCKRMTRYKYGSAEGATAMWRADQRAALELAERLPAEQLFTLRYEDLTASPEAVLSKLCAFLGVDYEAGMLEFHGSEDARRAADNSEAWRNLARPLMRDNSGRYAQTLTPEEVATVEAGAGALMARLGYAAQDPSRSQAEAAGGDASLHLQRLEDGSSGALVQAAIDRHLGLLAGGGPG